MCDIDESDCCGNGCANCILDSKPLSTNSTKTDLVNKTNVLHTYRKYKLIKRIEIQTHIILLKFTIANDKKQLTEYILDCPPGHHLMMRAPLLNEVENTETKTILRPYSPFWTDITEFEFEILVNLKPNGKMTEYIKNLELGDEVEFRGPIGVFVYEPSFADTALVIFAHGVAIAPTIPIVENILENEDDMSRIFHFSCFENIQNIIFRDKLMEYKRFWNFSSKIYLSRQKCTECVVENCEHFKQKLKFKEQIFSHRLNMQTINKNLEEFKKFGTRHFVICGSKSFQEFVEDCLVKCDVNKKTIFIL